MRFIPAHKQTDGDTTPLEAAKWPVELVLISNASGKEQLVNMDRIHQVLAPALCTACQMSPDQINFFPARQTRRGGPINPPSNLPMRAIPVCPALTSPHTHPRDPPRPTKPPPPGGYTTPPLATLPRYHIPDKPIHLVELCGGIATRLEALLKAGHAVASYTWADVDPDAHAATTHRLGRLHARHPLLPPEATSGWDTRVPMDTRTITPVLFAQVFPARVDLIMTSPPMLAKHLP
jgi:hypothetical protein